jgi:hypothetical protein
VTERDREHGDPATLLEGNGAGLLRERALAAAIQTGLERLYQLDRVADVGAFVSEAPRDGRETLLVRMGDDGAVEMSLRLPLLGRPDFDVLSDGDLDPLCQIIEGVSHFVYLAARAREERETTQLELELQAEVDKYVVLVAATGATDEPRSTRIRERLYDDVSFTSEEGTEVGDRYRMANQVAARFVRRLERTFLRGAKVRELHRELRRFYRLGQEEKLRVALSA